MQGKIKEMTTKMKEFMRRIKEKIGIMMARKGEDDWLEDTEIAIEKKERIPISFSVKKFVMVGSAACVTAAVITVGIIGFNYVTSKASQKGEQVTNTYKEEEVILTDIVVGVTESGSASMLSTEVYYEFQTEIEEVYVKSGEYIEEGQAIAKIDLDAYADACEALEINLDNATLSLKEAQLQAETTALDANTKLISNSYNGENATNLYDLTITELENNYVMILNEIAALEEDIADLEYQVSDWYGEEFGLDDLTVEKGDNDAAIASKNAQIAAQSTKVAEAKTIMERIEAEVKEKVDSAMNASCSTAGTTTSTEATSGACECCDSKVVKNDTSGTMVYTYPTSTEHEEYWIKHYEEELGLSAATASYNQAQSSLESLNQELSNLNATSSSIASQMDQAEENYEADREKLPDEIAEAYEKLTLLNIERDNYEVTMDTKKMEADATYNENVLNYNNKDASYSTTVEGSNNVVEAAQREVENLQEELAEMDAISSDGMIVSPCAGYVMTISEEGTSLNANGTIATIADKATVDVEVSIAQEDISAITIGMETNVLFDAYPDVIVPALVDSISIIPAGGMQSSISYTVTIRCDLTDFIDMVIYQAMTADVTFIQKQKQDVLVVSNKCIISQDGKEYVKVKNKDGSIEMVAVETGFSDGFDVEITAGLSEGDIVIIESAVM